MASLRKTVSVVIDATENLSSAVKKGASALVHLDASGKRLTNVQKYARLAEQQFKKMQPTINAIGKGLKQAAAVGAIALAALTATGVKGLSAWSEAEVAVVKLEGAMRNLGNYSSELSSRYQQLSSDLQAVTTHEDEAIQDTITLLTQVGRVGKENMPRATEAALDLADALGIDLHTASLLMAKAAAGETSMLGRYGIMVDEMALKTRGFAAVLDVVNSKFGGTARDKALTLAGAWAQLKNRIGDMLELVGKRLDPVVRMLIDAINPVIDGISAWLQEGTGLNAILAVSAEIINGLVQVVLALSMGLVGLIRLTSVAAEKLGTISEETNRKNQAVADWWDRRIAETAIKADEVADKIKNLPQNPPRVGGTGRGVAAGLGLDDFIDKDKLAEAGEAADAFLDKLNQMADAAADKRLTELATVGETIARAWDKPTQKIRLNTEVLEANRAKQAELNEQIELLKRRVLYTVDIADAVKDMINSTFSSIGEFIANVVAGVDGAGKSMAAGLLDTIGSISIQLGTFVIMSSKALASLMSLNVFAGLGFGAALIALGGILKGASAIMSKQPSAAASGAGTPGGGGYQSYQSPSQQQAQQAGPRYYIIAPDSSGRPHEVSQRTAERYIERGTSGQVSRELKRMIRTDEVRIG